MSLRVQEFKGSRVQGVQEFKEFKSLRVQEFKEFKSSRSSRIVIVIVNVIVEPLAFGYDIQ